MLLRRLPVLSALLVLLLAAGRCTAAALLRGSGTRTEGRANGGGGALEEVGRYPRSRTETLTGHGMRGGPERGGRSHHGLGEMHSVIGSFKGTESEPG